MPPDPDDDIDAAMGGPRRAEDDGGGGSLVKRLLVGLLILVVIAAAALITIKALGGKGGHGSTPRAHVPSPPPATVFSFQNVKVVPDRVDARTSRDAATPAAQDVQNALLAFYERAFVDPHTWARGVPADAWNVFATSDRARARGDAASLALGNQLPTLRSMSVVTSDLTIHVLLDQSGHAAAAVATVTFQSTGTLADGRTVQVDNEASFLFRRLQQAWLITGYPQAKTSVEPGPAPQPGPSGAPSASPAGAPVQLVTPSPKVSP